MKKLLIIACIAVPCYVFSHYAPMAIAQFQDYKKSSECIAQKMNEGRVHRSQIIVVGDTCKVKAFNK